MRIRNRDFEPDKKTYIMGILNITPDSFSDGGKHNTISEAIRRVIQMQQEGADIIDVGGESTRPGYQRISEEEEMERILPVIEEIRKETDIPISVDTYKSKVARAAFEAGADMLNDISCLEEDGLAKAAAEFSAAYCIMHNRKSGTYDSFLKDVKTDLRMALCKAEQAGVAKEKIMIDPGIGFAKNQEQNLEILRELKELKSLGYPILLGTSRKSVIGNVLELPVTERLEGTLATTAYGVFCGCGFVRVHDVKENVRVIRMLEAIL